MNRRLTAATVLAAAGLALTATPALAHQHDTTTRTWYLPDGVNPTVDPFEAWWPQTVAPVGQWCQTDTYRYASKNERRIVDGLDDDGLLTLVNGQPEDHAVYVSHTFTLCNPKPEPTPTPTETTPEPTPTETATPTPTETATPTPTDTPSETPTPTVTPSETPTVTPSETPSRTPSETPSSPAPSRTRTKPAPVIGTPTSRPPTTTPAVHTRELAHTGPVNPGVALTGGALLLAGAGLVAASRRRGAAPRRGEHQ